MQLLVMKIKRLARRFFIGAGRFLRHGFWAYFIAASLFFLACFGVYSMEKGSFAYCTDSLVRCLEDEAMTQKGLKKSMGIMKCSVRTLWCDLETLFYAATTRRAPAPLLDEPAPENPAKEAGVETLENPRTFQDAAAPDEPQGDASGASFEEIVRALESAGNDVFPEVEDDDMTGPELLEEMKRLRKEREYFEKNQEELRKKIFETLEMRHKTDILSEKENGGAP